MGSEEATASGAEEAGAPVGPLSEGTSELVDTLLSGSSASEEDSVGVEETDVSEDGGAADAAEEVVLLGLDPHAANAVAMVSAITMLKNFFIL